MLPRRPTSPSLTKTCPLTARQSEWDVASERQRGERGLEQAVERLEAADARADEDGALIALVEAVAWVTALDEWLLANLPSYTQPCRDSDPSGEVVHAMRWARNRGLHQLAALHDVALGFRWPLSWPAKSRHLVWRDRSKVTPGRSDPTGESLYDQRLVGETVGSTLSSAMDFLKKS